MPAKDSFSFKFFCISQPGGAPAKVFMRITVARKKVEVYTGNSVLAENWNETLQQSTHKKDRILNEDLAEIKNKIVSIKRRLQYEEKHISAKLIKDIYTGTAETKHSLMSYYRQYLSQIEKLTKRGVHK